MLELTPTEAVLLAAFLLSSAAVFTVVGWLTAQRLRQRALCRRALKAARRKHHAAAFRLLAAAERCWLPATLHPTAGNCQRSLEEYADILRHLAAAAGRLHADLDPAPMASLIQKRIALINKGLFRDVPREEVRSLERSFHEARMRLQKTCNQIQARSHPK